MNSTEQIMQHRSDWKYTMEGMKEERVLYRCRLCKQHFYVPVASTAAAEHDCEAGAGRAYVDQGRD